MVVIDNYVPIMKSVAINYNLISQKIMKCSNRCQWGWVRYGVLEVSYNILVKMNNIGSSAWEHYISNLNSKIVVVVVDSSCV